MAINRQAGPEESTEMFGDTELTKLVNELNGPITRTRSSAEDILATEL
ncbi:MAG: hypothetical protein O2904_04480 [bacterium]|nr:hypothetical protein [bacterium]